MPDASRLMPDACRRTCLHHDPRNWVETTVAGVLRVTCKRCGGFVGQRPLPVEPKQPRRAKR